MACGLLFPDDQDGFLVTRFSATLGRVLGACALLCSWAGSATTADDRIPLRVWGMHMGVSRFGWYAVIEEFERLHPNVRVVIGPTDRGQDLQKLLSGVVGNSPPDVFRRETLLLGDIAARDILMPLDEFADRHKDQQFAINPDDYYRGAWEQCFYDGHLYAIPEGAITLVLSYNRELFRKAGLDPDRPPRTWDEWRDCTEKLTIKDDEGNITQLGLVIYNRDDLIFYMALAGARAFSEDGRNCLLNSPAGVKTLTFITSLFDAMGGREAYNKFAAANLVVEELNPFGQGKIAMSVEDDWVIFRVARFSPDLDLGIAPVPTPTGDNVATMSPTGTCYMIPHNAHHPEEAWQFISFVNSPEGRLIKFKADLEYARNKGRDQLYIGFHTNRRVTEALVRDYGLRDPNLQAAYEVCRGLMDKMVPTPLTPVSAAARDEMLRAVNRVGYGQMTPEEAINDTTRRIQEHLDLYYGREEAPLLDWRYVWAIVAVSLAILAAIIFRRSRQERVRSRLRRYDNIMGPVFISPWLIGFTVLTLGPIIVSIVMSFCDYDVIHPARFVGLSNYRSLLVNDPLFWKSLWNTTFMVLSLPLGMCISLSIALLLNTKVRGMSFYRAVYYLPAITPIVASAVLWYVLLNPNGGINVLLGATICKWTGTTPPAWLQDPRWAKPAMVLMGLWAAGGGMILWLAGLQGIPESLYEAAAIDGAGWWRKFTRITLPMLTPYIFFTLVVGVIGVFQIFAQAVVLTAGEPADSTLFYVYYLFNNAFRYFKMGYASAQAWILFVLILILTLLQLKGAKKWVHYG